LYNKSVLCSTRFYLTIFEDYTVLFTGISTFSYGMQKNNLQFSPIRWFANFEKVIHNAARHVWPSIEVKGCCFTLVKVGIGNYTS